MNIYYGFKNFNNLKMIKYFNKSTNKYRYKAYDFKTKKLKGIEYNSVNLSNIYEGYSKGGIKCTFVSHNYNPYFLFRLFWFFISFKFQKPNNKLKPIRNQTIVTLLMIIGIIIAIMVGWDNITSFWNKYIGYYF